MTRPPTILVFDSGLGGLTVYREVVRVVPGATYVYVADDAFFPYGRHSEAALAGRVVPLMADLIASHAPDLVVIACNTASTQVLPDLRARFTVPFVGTVPAIKPACTISRSRLVSVLGTEATVKREYTRALIRDFGHGCEVTLVGATHLAAMTEASLRGEAVDDAALSREIAPAFTTTAGSRRTDTIVLACTHYPLLLDGLKRVAPWPVEWVDPAPAIARRVGALMGAGGSGTGGASTFVFTSGAAPSPRLSQALARFGFMTMSRIDCAASALFNSDLSAGALPSLTASECAPDAR